MSSVGIAVAAAPAVVGLGASPLLLVLIAGVVVYNAGKVIASCAGARLEEVRDREEAEERLRCIKAERKNSLLLLNGRITQELGTQIDALSDEGERQALRARLDAVSSGFRADIENEREDVPEAEFREIRQRILSVQMDERMARMLNEEFEKFEGALGGKVAEWGEIRDGLQRTNALPLQERIGALTALLERARAFAEGAARTADVSLAGLVEERYTLPPARTAPKGEAEGAGDERAAALVADILDFGARIAFLDDEEARAIRPLVDEASSEDARADAFRLAAIRREIKMRYGKLKERRVLTEIYREELRDALPLVRRARDAEALIVRMEELLTARDIPRGAYLPLHGEIKILLGDQLERITDEILAEKVGAVLDEMGYSLAREDGGLSAGEVNSIQSPYEGYRVKVKVDRGGTLSTRLVRVVESEEERDAASEYQRQKDLEVGKKWCRDLDALHERMRSEGIAFETALRKEPEELPLDVVVEADAGRKRKKTHAARKNAGRV